MPQNFGDPWWWTTTVVLALLLNVLGNFAKDWIERLWGRFSKGTRLRRENEQAEIDQEAALFAAKPEGLQYLAFIALVALQFASIFTTMAFACLVWVQVSQPPLIWVPFVLMLVFTGITAAAMNLAQKRVLVALRAWRVLNRPSATDAHPEGES